MRLTLRTRLTLVYGGLFLIGGFVLLVLTYSLVSNSSADASTISGSYQGSSEDMPMDFDPGGATDDSITYGEDLEVRISRGVWQDALDAVSYQGAIALGLVSVATVALGWLIAGRMLRSLQRVTGTAARIAEAPSAGQGLHERIKVDGPPEELWELAETFDRMLERLDHSFDGQRSFIFNAAHGHPGAPGGRRQPVRGLAGGPAARGDPAGGQCPPRAAHRRPAHALRPRTGRAVVRRPRRHRRLRRRPDSRPGPGGHGRRRRGPDPRRAGPAGAAGAEPGRERGPPQRARGRLGHTVVTRIGEDGRAAVEVSNSGPVVAVFEAPGLFEPFRRLATERPATASKGAGLGLSIVRDIAEAHGGEATATPPEGGLTVTVTLPAARPDRRSGLPRRDAAVSCGNEKRPRGDRGLSGGAA